MINYQQLLADHLLQLKESGSYRYFLDVNKSSRHFPRFYYEDANGGKRMAVNWCSNDYLCMSVHEEVISKLSFVAHNSGVGSGGTRNISGTTIYHRDLEQLLAQLHHKESALLFGSAYQANVTTLATLGKLLKQLVIISDEGNHASLIEGIKASGAEKIIFRHNDSQHLEEILAQLPENIPRLIVFESVYSISGTTSPMTEILLLAKKYHCLTYIDEVHAVGLYGEDGGGLSSQLELREGIDIVNGTLAKGFGVIGGYIAASKTIVDAVRSFGSGFIFTTSLPPAICAAAAASIRILIGGKPFRRTFHQKVKQFREILASQGVPFTANDTHITPVPVGDEVVCKNLADTLLYEYGIYLQPINFPTVPMGKACLRITVTLKHELTDMIHLAESLSLLLNKPEEKQHSVQWIS